LVTDDAYLSALVPYVAMNPVAAALCARPEEWPWSSHAHVAAGLRPAWLAHDRLLELLGEEPAQDHYDRLIEARWN
jgi:putative transposase